MSLSLKQLVFGGAVLATMTASAAVAEQKASPDAEVHQAVGNTKFDIKYCQPGVKGRQIFGKLVPFNEVWRTGANAATKITFNHAIKFGGTDVPEGSYALFTIPGKESWTVILSKKAEQFGAFEYNKADDKVRVTVKPANEETAVERFTN